MPDAGFLKTSTIEFLSEVEVKEILFRVREELLPELDRQISVWRDNHSSSEDPEDYFSHFKTALSDYAKAFDDDPVALAWIEEGIGKIDEAVEELQSQMPDAWDRTTIIGANPVLCTRPTRARSSTTSTSDGRSSPCEKRVPPPPRV